MSNPLGRDGLTTKQATVSYRVSAIFLVLFLAFSVRFGLNYKGWWAWGVSSPHLYLLVFGKGELVFLTHNLSRLMASAMVVACFCAPTMAQNLFANPGFEDPITFDGPPFFGFWEGFNGADASASNSTSMPRTGDQSLELSVLGANSFAGAFQDVFIAPGEEGTFSGWHKSLGEPGGTEIRIEWRDSVLNTEVGRTPNFVPMVGSDYEPFEFSAVAPLGADSARVVYAIQSFGALPGQSVFVDDVSFTVIPEPASLGLLAFAGLSLLAIRRR